ncbi:hypothetical protein [Bacillus cereus group sp. BfR-BA-01383]|uniref:hypothetical protein n=1 Tax=Bacillus cereus group sp. BfR-BA-01383 TaxID=2920327 RepID=UPI001F57A8BE|nr:hypothetical protein [Bacillus cereus group sp. BfR-BA-01383]
MLETKFYSWRELEDLLEIQFTKKNNRAKLIRRNIEPYYVYEVVKEGRPTIGLEIVDYKEKQKSEFIRICEKIAGQEVTFPREKNAEQLLKLLLEGNWTIFNNEVIGINVPDGLEEHTVGKYMNLFKKYKLIPKKIALKPRLVIDLSTGEIESKWMDPNQYTYYKVNKKNEIREEIEEEEYREMLNFIKRKYSEYVSWNLEFGNMLKDRIPFILKEANSLARQSCVTEFGAVPMKAISKVPTGKVYRAFAKYLGLSFEEEGTEEECYLISHLTEQEKNFMKTVKREANLESVIGRNPLERDWDKFVVIGRRGEEDQLETWRGEENPFDLETLEQTA